MPENSSEIYPEINTSKGIKQWLKRPSKKNLTILLSSIGLLLIFTVLVISFLPKKTVVTPPPVVKDITLHLWSYTENAEHYKKLISDYEALNPHVTISFEQRDANNYNNALYTRFSTNPSTVGDIVELDNEHENTFFPYLSPAPATILTPSDFSKLFYDQMKRDNVSGENIYGVPTGNDGLMLAYNTNYVKGTELPIYWTDFIKLIGQKTQPDPLSSGKNIVNGLAFNTDPQKTKYLSDIIQLVLFQNNIQNFYNTSGQISLDTKIAADSLSVIGQIINQKSWDGIAPNSIQSFINGNTAFAFITAADIQTIQSANPNLSFKTSILPIISNQVFLSKYTSYGVNSYSPNTLESWKFLKFLSSEDSEKYLYSTAASFHLSTKPYALKSLVPSLQSDPNYAPIGTMAPNMTNWASVNRDATDLVFANFVHSLSSVVSPDQITILNLNLTNITPGISGS